MFKVVKQKWSSDLLNRFRNKPVYNFRTEYVQPSSARINWYPGHMAKSLRQLKDTFIPRSHIIVEVRDIRIPLSSDVPQLSSLIRSFNRKRLIVYNKLDLLNPRDSKRTKRFLRMYHAIHHPDTELVFCEGRDKRSCSQIVHHLKSMARTKFKSLPTVVAILGIPNVGKSTILNSLRRYNYAGGAKVAPMPGVTRHISTFRVIPDPPINIMDTPGIFIPAHDVASYETGMRISLCNAIPDEEVGKVEICDYLLYRYNKESRFEYVDTCSLKQPSDDIHQVLTAYATKKRWHLNGALNINLAADRFLNLFREAELSSFVLDELDFDSLGQATVEMSHPEKEMSDFAKQYSGISDDDVSGMEFLEYTPASLSEELDLGQEKASL